MESSPRTSGFISTQRGLRAVASLMAVPSLMVFLSPAPPAPVARRANIVTGTAFTAIIVATMPGAWMITELLG